MNTPDLTSALPFSDEGEKAILSTLMQYPQKAEDVASELTEDHFYHPINRLLFSTLLICHGEGRPMDLVGMTHYLMDAGLMDKVGGPATLTDLYSFLPTHAHYYYYRDILVQKLKLRQFLSGLEEARKNALEIGHEDPVLLIQSTLDTIDKILKDDPNKKDPAFKEQLNEYVDVLEKRILGQVQTGIPSRWPSWNRAFGGITPTMFTICAYQKSGKTSLVQNLAEDVLEKEYGVLWFNYEMSKTETIDRLVCAKSRVPSEKVFFPMQNIMSKEEAKKVMQAISGMKKQKLHLRCEPTWTLEKLVIETRRMIRKHPEIRLVIIDYLQIIPTKKEFKNRSEQVAYISRTVKREIQAAHEVAVVILSQLNDDGKTLDSRAPLQDSSCVLTIEREHTETVKGKTTTYPAGIRVNLNRNLQAGQLLKIRLDGQFFTFEEYTPDVVKQ